MSGSDQFRLNQWRAGVAGRRRLARDIIAEAIDIGSVELVINRIRREMLYDRLERADQNLFKVMASSLRKIAENWHRLGDRDKSDFLSGKTPYSSLRKIIDRQSAGA